LREKILAKHIPVFRAGGVREIALTLQERSSVILSGLRCLLSVAWQWRTDHAFLCAINRDPPNSAL